MTKNLMISTIMATMLSVITIASFKNVDAAEAQQAPAMPVEVTIIEQQSLRLWKEFSGRLTAVDFVEIRPQASGLITEIKFDDGQFVKKGDVLYILDPRLDSAIVAQKEAELLAAQNSYAFADMEYERAIDLTKRKMVAQQVLDNRFNTKLVAHSMVKLAQAELSEAKVDLSYTMIKAPISGLISRTELTVGNLVSAGPNAPLLTSIVANKTLYADFEVDEQTYLRLKQGMSSEEISNHDNPVELRIQNGEWMVQGKLHAFDNKIDPASGTIRARAIFDNSEGRLLSGMYARLKLGSALSYPQILLTERAIATDQNRKFVYVVNAENKTTYREVEIGDSIDGQRVILSGLAIGDVVIVRGLMRIRPNMLVEPQQTTSTGNDQ